MHKLRCTSRNPKARRYISLNRVIYLNDIGYDQVEDDEDSENPETYEKVFWEIHAHDIYEHVTRDEPVVYYHYMEKSHHRCTKIIEIHQVV